MQNRSIIKTLFAASGLFVAGAILTGTLTGCMSEKELSSNQTSLVSGPVLNAQLTQDDFSFPSRPPQLSKGKVVFQQNCLTCHGVGSVSYDKIRDTRPIDTYLLLSRGDKGHPAFKDLTRDQRWEAVFYYRYLGGETVIKNQDTAAIFGGNCAVCHGGRGFADGPLHTGHASAHELGMAPVKNDFNPPPANFHSYPRMYNRTNDQLVQFIEQGIYPSAMPSWKGRIDKDKNAVFDDSLILDLVKYVRGFAIENDLPDNEKSDPSKATFQSSSKELSSATPRHDELLEKKGS